MNKKIDLVTIKNEIAYIKSIIATQDCDYKIQYTRLAILEQQLKDIEEKQ